MYRSLQRPTNGGELAPGYHWMWAVFEYVCTSCTQPPLRSIHHSHAAEIGHGGYRRLPPMPPGAAAGGGTRANGFGCQKGNW